MKTLNTLLYTAVISGICINFNQFNNMIVKNIFVRKHLQKKEYIEFYAFLIYALIQRRFHLDNIQHWSGQHAKPHLGCSYGHTLSGDWKDKSIVISLTYPQTIITRSDGGGTNMMLLPEETKIKLFEDLRKAIGKRVEVEYYTSGLTQEEYINHQNPPTT